MNNLDWRRILITSAIVGLLAGGIPLLFGTSLLATTMPVAMMFATYLTIPRAKASRFLNGLLVSVLSAIFAMIVFFAVEFLFADRNVANQNLQITLKSMPMLIVIISVFGSWFFSWTHNWTEKKRREMDAKRGATAPAKSKPYVSRPTKKKYKKKKK
jgi:hypothetical protein